MAIFGLTVSETGEQIQRLAVSTRVAIGERVRRGDKTFPAKLDHFIFLRKSSSLEWEHDPVLQKHYGDTCREISIVLLDDMVERNFVTEYAWWSRTEKKCWGNGRDAIRRTEKNPRGEDWKPCGTACSDLGPGDCKPAGDLYFILADFPRLGSVCRLHTGSYRSILQINSSLTQISGISGGRLAGLRVKLVVRPEKTTYTDDAGAKRSATFFALNLELAGRETKQLLARTQLALCEGNAIEDSEDRELSQQELPHVCRNVEPAKDSETAGDEPQKTVTGKEKLTREQRLKLVEIAERVGWSSDQVKEILRGEFGVSSSADITADQFDSACSRLGNYQAIDSDIPF
jgi:hypothetical protein